jgi:hypothetical protein
MLIIKEEAFAKLLWFRKNCNENTVFDKTNYNNSFLEVSLMGVSVGENGDDLLTVEDFVCVPQECTSGNTEPTDQGMAIYFENMMLDKGIMPNRCGRIWAHTHPGQSPQPSGTDDETYRKWFKDAEFAVMYILAEGNNYCKIKHTSKQLGSLNTVVEVYIMLNKVDRNGNPEYISTTLFFEIEKLATKMGEMYNVFDDHSDKHDAWLEELRSCVKKKSYNTHHHQPHNQQSTHSASGRTHEKEEDKKKEQKTIIYTTTSHKFTTASLLGLMIRYKKDTINSFGHKGIEEIAQHYGISTAQVNQTYNNLLAMEKYSESTMTELVMDYVNELIVDGVNAIKSGKIGNTMLQQICEDIMARPCVISEAVDNILTKAGSSNG